MFSISGISTALYEETVWFCVVFLTLITAPTGFDTVAKEADAKQREWKKKQGKISRRLMTYQNCAKRMAKLEQRHFIKCSKCLYHLH